MLFGEMMKSIDFHAHVLPNADHGSDSIEVSLKQIKYAQNAGVNIVVATPHFYPHIHNVPSFVSKRDKAAEELIFAANAEFPDIKIIKGAEVLICEGLEKLPMLEKLCIENTKTILIELPFSGFKLAHVETIEAIIALGYDIVIAHADRYDPEDIDELLPLGVKIQLNASALAVPFIRKHIKAWINGGFVVAIGSDIHMKDSSAYARFLRAIRKLGKNYDKVMEASNKILG